MVCNKLSNDISFLVFLYKIYQSIEFHIIILFETKLINILCTITEYEYDADNNLRNLKTKRLTLKVLSSTSSLIILVLT